MFKTENVLSEYANIMAQFRFFGQVLGLKINVKDIYNLIPQDSLLRIAFSPYQTHNSQSYCRCLKKYVDKNGCQYCLKRFMDNVYPKCLASDKPFFGMCYAGVYEYVLPIWCEGELIFVLNIGSFRKSGLPSGERAVKRFCRQFAVSEEDAAELREAYGALPEAPGIEPELLGQGFVYIAEAIRNAYLRIRGGQKRGVPQKEIALPATSFANGNAVIDRAVDFILKNYSERLTVARLAEVSGCSESYINHNFRQYVGMSTVDFINTVRVRMAVKLIVETDYSLTRIAFLCGFESSGYFSRMFSKATGMPPSSLR